MPSMTPRETELIQILKNTISYAEKLEKRCGLDKGNVTLDAAREMAGAGAGAGAGAINIFDTSRRHTVRVTFANGEKITTEINGTPTEVCDYYIGKTFNLGAVHDDLQIAQAIEFHDGEQFLKHKRSII